MAEKTAFEQELAELLVTSLDLEDVEVSEIDPEAALFGNDPAGLGLDSIDALEIALAINQKYGVELRADDEENSQVFSTLRALANHVEAQRADA